MMHKQNARQTPFSATDESDWIASTDPQAAPGTSGDALDHLGNVAIIKVSATDPDDHAVGLGWLDTSIARAGSIRVINTITVDTTIDATFDVILVDASSGAVTITLPAAATNTVQFDIKKIDSSGNNVTVDANGTETIDDGLTAVITAQYESITIVSDAANWWVI